MMILSICNCVDGLSMLVLRGDMMRERMDGMVSLGESSGYRLRMFV